MKILQVNTNDTRGGAAQVAGSLHQAYRNRGHDSWQIVGHKLGEDEHILPIKHGLSAKWWQRPFWKAEDAVARRRFKGARWLGNVLRIGANRQHFVDWYNGYEDFSYPGTKHLLDTAGSAVDILHLHNLHGHYFDLRQLPYLTQKVPSVLSLHDAWLLSGHCAFSFGCDRWRIGCGHCPDLKIQPAIRRDATAENWQRKSDIFSKSRFHVITPSQWLMDMVQASSLSRGLKSSRVIPHGVDLDIFHPGDKLIARHRLGLPENEQIILMVANGFRNNPWKDFDLARKALSLLSTKNPNEKIMVLAVGDTLPDERINNIFIHFVPYKQDKTVLAQYYQAADVLLSTSRVEVWGLAISEALSCGTPVVATAVGGIPEQVASWPLNNSSKANGILTGPDDDYGLTEALSRILNDTSLQKELSFNAGQRAQIDLDFNSQVEHTIAYYHEIIIEWKTTNAR